MICAFTVSFSGRLQIEWTERDASSAGEDATIALQNWNAEEFALRE